MKASFRLAGKAMGALLLMALSLPAASHEPFSLGCSMGNNGTIMQPSGMSGRQPWIPACFFADSLRFGIAVCGIDYYDQMDNLESSRIRQAVIGGWYAQNRCIAKAAYAYFNALDLYNEQQGFCSIGLSVMSITASVDITGCRAGLLYGNDPPRTFLHAGASMLVQGKTAALSLSCSHCALKNAPVQGFEPPLTVSAGAYATVNRYGSQGVVFEMSREAGWAFRISMGEEYCFSRYFSLCTALSTNPFTLHFGCAVSPGRSGIALSFVNNPVLGWSKGLTLDYAHR